MLSEKEKKKTWGEVLQQQFQNNYDQVHEQHQPLLEWVLIIKTLKTL